MKNLILNDIIENKKGHYCHALEVNNIDDLKNCIETLYSEFIEKYTLLDIVEFFESISIYSLNDNNEKEIYDFNIKEYINNL